MDKTKRRVRVSFCPGRRQEFGFLAAYWQAELLELGYAQSGTATTKGGAIADLLWRIASDKGERIKPTDIIEA